MIYAERRREARPICDFGRDVNIGFAARGRTQLKKMRLACIFALALLWPRPPSRNNHPRDAKRAGDRRAQAAKNADHARSLADAKAAFLALAEADRKAVQDALGWLGFYNGVDRRRLSASARSTRWRPISKASARPPTEL